MGAPSRCHILRWWRHNIGLELQDFEKIFHKRIPHFKAPFTFDFHLSFTISTWGKSYYPFSSQFWVDDVTTLIQNFEILRGWCYKRIFHLKGPFLFDFHLSTNIDTWNNIWTILINFWVDDVTTGSQDFKILR